MIINLVIGFFFICSKNIIKLYLVYIRVI